MALYVQKSREEKCRNFCGRFCDIIFRYLKMNHPNNSNGHFEETGEAYAKYRPGYGEAIFDDLSKEVPGHELAVDCGCGTGQIAESLSSRFDKVFGVDVSKDQLAHAFRAPNIEYVNRGAEDLSFLADGSVDLITVGTAYHWFDSGRFWSEARRVLKPGGIVAILQIATPEIKETPGLLRKFLKEELEPHTPAVKSSNAELREEIPVGFERVKLPNVYRNELRKRVSDVLGWLKTTSAYRPYMEKTGRNPSDKLSAEFKAKGFESKSEITFDNTASVLAFRKQL